MRNVDQILADMNRTISTPAEEKTASVATEAPSIEAARTDLDASLATVLGNAPGVKEAQANGGDVTGHLEKIARDLADADDIATIKEGQLYGAAVFDGFIQRANQYAQHAPGEEKVASHAAYDQAAAAGYHAMQDAFGHQKTAAEQAQEDFENGVRDGLDKVAAATVNCFERGFNHMQKIAEALQSE